MFKLARLCLVSCLLTLFAVCMHSGDGMCVHVERVEEDRCCYVMMKK